jgi:hypothetical protein
MSAAINISKSPTGINYIADIQTTTKENRDEILTNFENRHE